MKNKTGNPFAFKELDSSGLWNIFFDPLLKLDGYYYYEVLTGPIDEANANLIVDLLNMHDKKIKGAKNDTMEKR